jgi:FkbM family methyltransferase
MNRVYGVPLKYMFSLFISPLLVFISRAASMIRDLLALLRSLRIYRFDHAHQQSLSTLYQPFVKKDGLVFDIGAHAGDRTACFRRLGARVVSIEPQTIFAWFLRVSNAWHSQVTVLSCVVSRTAGLKTLRVNTRNPTVSTLSDSFVQAANSGAVGWQGQQWDRSLIVKAVTLDDLIEQHGRPDFIKIDVEGAELDVLSGLSQSVPALSFEFTMIQRQLTVDCIERCLALGLIEFNVSMGESHQLAFEAWIDGQQLKAYLSALADEANSGDVYARCAAVINC